MSWDGRNNVRQAYKQCAYALQSYTQRATTESKTGMKFASMKNSFL